MKIKVITSHNFRKEAKPLLKKYPSLHGELANLEKVLIKNPFWGTPIEKNCFKIRLAIKSKGKGKLGGARVITFVVVNISKDKEKNTLINLASIYDKSQYDDIEDKDLRKIIKEIKKELNLR